VFQVNAGSLFPALRRLERDGLITGEWRVTENNRRAKYYTLTTRGRTSYNVAQRRSEIGVRAALGATQGDLVRMVLREGLTVTVIGLVVGVAVAALSMRAMASVLFGVTPLDSVAFSVGPFLLLVVTCAACLIPARRAASIDPAKALRAE
jgi:predicted lysophospholipase L1 biosynthesis ABC-type transport system permease subunit